MSVDNGVYILQCKDQYRVKHLQAIDNLYWDDKEGVMDDIVPLRAVEMFGDCKYTRDFDKAVKIASYILRDLSTCEYGIQIIPCNKKWKHILRKADSTYKQNEENINKMNFIEAVELLTRSPQGTKIKASNWYNDYIYMDRYNLNIIKTQSGEAYSPCAWTLINDTFEIVKD
ncbi:hypothetical protein [Anaerovorax sp. IOR16]|uniref:hypothetical protein n=1 Tax=Anaerovorax sp. IOR16 TaxID=2773458 RepID=UPI0019D1231A|nr:hypothetical protein [Anaerovorax sp. IOR16]